MEYIKTRKAFIEMISKEEYKFTDFRAPSYPSFLKLKSYGNMTNLFEELTEKLGRTPTENEYVFEGFNRSRAYFTDPAKVKGTGDNTYRWFPLDKKIENGKQIVSQWGKFYFDHPIKGELLRENVKSRLSYNYVSNIVEMGVVATLCDLGYLVGVNDLVDGVFGVDVVVGVPELDKVIYLHVTTKKGMRYVKEKENKDGFTFDDNGKGIWFKGRDYSVNHQYLLYGTKLGESEGVELINGNPVITAEQIESVILDAVENKSDKLKSPAQLLFFDNWLKNNGIKNGIGKIWINKNILKGDKK